MFEGNIFLDDLASQTSYTVSRRLSTSGTVNKIFDIYSSASPYHTSYFISSYGLSPPSDLERGPSISTSCLPRIPPEMLKLVDRAPVSVIRIRRKYARRNTAYFIGGRTICIEPSGFITCKVVITMQRRSHYIPHHASLPQTSAGSNY